MKITYMSFLLVLILSSCMGAVTSAPITETFTVSPTGEFALPPTAIIAPTLVPDPTATPNASLLLRIGKNGQLSRLRRGGQLRSTTMDWQGAITHMPFQKLGTARI